MAKFWVHIIGIAGNTTAPLAKLFKKDFGWKVTGSEQKNIYEPLKFYLENNGINYFLGYNDKHISREIDLVVIGGSALIADPDNPEYKKAKALGLPIISHSQALARFFIKPESICIAGTYGKTTITALTSWIFEKAGRNPNYFVGDKCENLEDYIWVAESDLSIVEADEFRHPWFSFDDKPRFLHYKPKYVLVNAAQWEHKDVYASEEEYIKAFQDFVSLVPKEGLLMFNKSGENLKKILPYAKCRKVSFSREQGTGADWELAEYSYQGEKTAFSLKNGEKTMEFFTPLFGSHNLEDILAAVSLSSELGIELPVITRAVSTFKGVRRRLELIGKFNETHFYDDFCQSVIRIRASLKALREKFPKKKILVIFDPHAGFLQKKISLSDYENAFFLANEVIISGVMFRPGVTKEERISGRDWVEMVAKGQKNVKYLPIDEELIKCATSGRRGWVIVFMSSGGLKGERIRKQIVAKLKKKQ